MNFQNVNLELVKNYVAKKNQNQNIILFHAENRIFLKWVMLVKHAIKFQDAISSNLNVSNRQLHKHALASAALADGEDITEAGLEMQEIPLQLRNVPSQQAATATTSDTLPPPYSPS